MIRYVRYTNCLKKCALNNHDIKVLSVGLFSPLVRYSHFYPGGQVNNGIAGICF